MDPNKKLKNDERGWYNDPIEHGLAAKGIETGRTSNTHGVPSVPIGEQIAREQKRTISPEEMEYYRATMKEKFPEFEKGEKSQKYPHVYTPTKVRCVECGEIRAVREPVMRKRLYRMGGWIPAKRGYQCQKCRPHREHIKSEVRAMKAERRKRLSDSWIS